MSDLVITTWDVIKQIPDYQIVAGNILFRRIFDQAPGAHKIFSFLKEYDELDDSVFEKKEMHRHYKLLFGKVNSSISLLKEGKKDKMIESLNELGARHIKYGVGKEHYPIVGEALLFTVKAALGDGFTDDVELAWAEFYKTITDAMLPLEM